jgi:hypothetical protein
VGLLGRGAAGPVFLHVGTTFVEPTVVGYEPTEGCTTDPYPSVPVVCASASVLVRVNAVASAIVVTFMVVSFGVDKETTRRPLGLSAQFFFSATGAAKLFTSRRAKQSSSIIENPPALTGGFCHLLHARKPQSGPGCFEGVTDAV